MVGFLKKLERTDVPFLQAAEILYGQGGEVHVHPANAAAILFRTVNRVNGFQYIINTASGIRLASHHEYALMPLPQQDLCFLPDLVRIQCPADRLFIGSSECAVQALIGTEVGDVQRSKKDNPVSVDLFLHGFGRMKQFVQ